jgi:hypothetical protein
LESAVVFESCNVEDCIISLEDRSDEFFLDGFTGSLLKVTLLFMDIFDKALLLFVLLVGEVI